MRKWSAIMLFIDYYKKTGEIIPRKDFVAAGYSIPHYYYVKREFEANLDSYIGDEE